MPTVKSFGRDLSFEFIRILIINGWFYFNFSIFVARATTTNNVRFTFINGFWCSLWLVYSSTPIQTSTLIHHVPSHLIHKTYNQFNSSSLDFWLNNYTYIISRWTWILMGIERSEVQSLNFKLNIQYLHLLL